MNRQLAKRLAQKIQEEKSQPVPEEPKPAKVKSKTKAKATKK